jgi:hypothetical protein
MAIGDRHKNGVNTQENLRKTNNMRPLVAKTRIRPSAD